MSTSPKAKELRPGDILFKEGDKSKSLFLVQRGSIAIRKAKGSGFVELAKINSGEILGELSFFDRMPRSATAIATTASEVLEIQFEAMEKIYESTPPYMRTIVASMADRLRQADEEIRKLKDYTRDDKTSDDSELSDLLDAIDSDKKDK